MLQRSCLSRRKCNCILGDTYLYVQSRKIEIWNNFSLDVKKNLTQLVIPDVIMGGRSFLRGLTQTGSFTFRILFIVLQTSKKENTSKKNCVRFVPYISAASIHSFIVIVRVFIACCFKHCVITADSLGTVFANLFIMVTD